MEKLWFHISIFNLSILQLNIYHSFNFISLIVMKYWVYIWRFNPLHLWHQHVIQTMIEDNGIENCLVVVWSVNQPLSDRNIFSYQERENFLREKFPWLKVVWIPDFDTDDEWFEVLDKLIDKAFPSSWKHIWLQDVVFYGWAEQDIWYILPKWYTYKIVSRNDGQFDWLSSTKVRESLRSDKDISWMVDPSLVPKIKHIYNDMVSY